MTDAMSQAARVERLAAVVKNIDGAVSFHMENMGGAVPSHLLWLRDLAAEIAMLRVDIAAADITANAAMRSIRGTRPAPGGSDER